MAQGEKAAERGSGGVARGSEEMGMKVSQGGTSEEVAFDDGRIQKMFNKLWGVNLILEMIPAARHCPHVGIRSSSGLVVCISRRNFALFCLSGLVTVKGGLSKDAGPSLAAPPSGSAEGRDSGERDREADAVNPAAGDWEGLVAFFEESRGLRWRLLARPTAPGVPLGPPALTCSPRVFSTNRCYYFAVLPVFSGGSSVRDKGVGNVVIVPSRKTNSTLKSHSGRVRKTSTGLTAPFGASCPAGGAERGPACCLPSGPLKQ